jgi:hypothetical protein
MSKDDEIELHRLCGMLRQVEKGLDSKSPLREAVSKASLGLSLAFIHGLRPKMEDWALGIGRPLNEEQQAHLRSLGIDPDSDLPT